MHLPNKRLIILINLFFFLYSFKTSAQNYQSEISLKLDNDYYIAFKQDRYYTHGTFANYKHALKTDTVNSPYLKKILDLEVGQRIYNPFWSNAPDVTLHDRPFAGYSYVSMGMNWFNKKNAMLKSSMQLGILGPGSYAEEVQTAFHKLINGYYPVAGWDYQVKNELIVNLGVEYFKKATKDADSPFDIHYYGHAQLGNFNTALHAGAVFRLGKFNALQSSSLFGSRIARQGQSPKMELFLYYQPQLNLAIYDGSIQGGLFRADKGPVTYDIKPLVFQQVVGLNAAYKRLGFKYLVTFRTREVQSNAKSYYYGSFVFSYLFQKN